MKGFLLGGAAFLVALVACSGSTEPAPVIPPITVTTVSLTPTASAVVKGSQLSLVFSAQDGAGNKALNVKATWSSGAPRVASVANDGTVTALDYGTATIKATVGDLAAYADVVVTSAPAVRMYSVLDLSGSTAAGGSHIRNLSDSGDVLSAGPVLYRHGVATALTGCGSGLAINGVGHVLCSVYPYDSVSNYAIWHDGNLTPLAAVDTFKAQNFRAFALSDSDEVPGLFFTPAFTNANCPANGARCLSVWKNGVATFPGYNAGGNDVMQMNNRKQIVVEYAMWNENEFYSTVYDIPSARTRSVPYGVVINDNGWGAIASPWIAHGSSSPFRSTASVMTPDSVITLGSGAATGINNADVVVGTLDVGPFIWRGQGVSLLTNASVDTSWTITAADEINNRGQILATADNADGRKGHTVLLTPTQP